VCVLTNTSSPLLFLGCSIPPPSVKQEQISIRENAIQQANALVQYKKAFCRCHQLEGNRPKSKASGGVLSIFVSLLAEPLSRTGNARTDTDHLTIEIVLHLFRNLLAADPLFLVTTGTAPDQLHHEFILVLERELVLDILYVLAAEIERRENAQYNLLLMELLQHLLRHHDPTVVARCGNNSNSSRSRDGDFDVPPQQQQQRPARKPTTGLLLESINRQRQAMKSQATSRHSHFGGMLVVPSSGGGGMNNTTTTTTKRLVSAGRADTTNFTKTAPAVARRGKETFIGASNRAAHQRHAWSTAGSGPLEQKSALVIHSFCQRFMETCYGPVMKSLKNEFRRDSVRLEDGDKVVFFRIAWFFCQWWSASTTSSTTARGGKTNNTNTTTTTSVPTLNDNGLSVGHLVHTMDLYTFNLVFNAADTFMEHKKYPSMAQAVALLSEMMHVLHAMYSSKLGTEKIMALGLMEHLFYSPEPLDRLPKLLSHWSPGIAGRDYLCDLLQVSHLTLKLLDSFAKECHTKQPNDGVTLTKKKAVAARFNVPAYFARKIVSNLTVSAFTHLLASYDINSTTVNHRLIAFFTRLTKHVISTAETTADDGGGVVNPLPARASTYEPLLYNFQMLTTLEKILNDTAIRKNPEYAAMLQFASTITYNFAVHAKKNPMLFVEVLLKHPLPHRYCDQVANLYVSDDVRLMIERDLLLDLQHKLDEKVAAIQRGDGDDDGSSDEELEFEDEEEPNDVPDDNTAAKKYTKKKATLAKRKAIEAPNDDDKNSNDRPPQQNDDSSDDEEAKALEERKKKRAKKDNAFKKRMACLNNDKVNADSSSDDEAIFGGTLTASAKLQKPGPRSSVWDSDDDV
jgi:timeless